MKLSFDFMVLLTAVSTAAGTSSCPEMPISIAGSPSVERLATAWKDAFLAEKCPQAEISVEGGGSSAGAARVCGTRANAAAVDIGGMTRTFNSGEATLSGVDTEWNFQCERSNRDVIQVSAKGCCCNI